MEKNTRLGIRWKQWLGLALACVLAPVLTTASDATIPTRLFDPGFLEGDCNYHNLTSASNGNLYFTLGTHNDQTPTHIYRFDPTSEQISLIANLSEVLGESPQDHSPHGKIHTPLIEHEGYFER